MQKIKTEKRIFCHIKKKNWGQKLPNFEKRIEIFSSHFREGIFLTSFWDFAQLNAKSLFEMLASAIWKKQQPLIIAVEISFQNSTIGSVELKCKSNEDFQNQEKKMRLLIFES